MKRKTRIPSYSEILKSDTQSLYSNEPLRLLGVGEEYCEIREEERKAHMHIIGTTQEGKSRFLEHLIREDIRRGKGLCFLDPSHNANTLHRVLAFCESINFKKVLLIDPHHHHLFKKVVPLNPFYKFRQASITHVQSIIEVLFDMKNMVQFAFIGDYLPALIGALHDAKATLSDAVYFSDNEDPYYRSIREQIFDSAFSAERDTEYYADGIKIQSAMAGRKFVDFGSTLRRMNLIYQHETLKLMLGTRKKINFDKIIEDGWVVLVNLNRGFGMTAMHTKLLGTAVLNELIFTINRLTYKGWRGQYYLYIDEAGEYANDQLADLLELKSQAGLSVILAHQLTDQLPAGKIRRAVTGMTKMKVAFHQPDAGDRLETVKALYGGALEDRAVSYALKQLKKQQAVIMPPKRDPQIVWIPDVEKLPLTKGFVEEIYKAPHYLSPEDIQDEITKRFEGTNTVRAGRGTKSNRRAANRTDGRKTGYGTTRPQKVERPQADSGNTDSDDKSVGNREWEDLFS